MTTKKTIAQQFAKGMKKAALSAALTLVAATATAGGYVTNTNQNAAFGRNLSQEAMIDILATYANPAGVAFLPRGWHAAFSNQSAFQTREAESWFVNPTAGPFQMGVVNGVQNTSATKTYKGKATAPIIPSLDIAYVEDRWSLAFHFGVIGGGGKCEFDDGLGSFESKVALLPTVLNTLAGTTAYRGYAFDTYMRGRQYYFGGQINGTYKVLPNLSVALGVRGVYATSNYYGYVSNMHAIAMDGTQTPVSTAMAGLAAPLIAAVPEVSPVMAGIAGLAGDVRLNCDQTGFGITPIIGVDWKINDHWNVAAKYEFQTRLRLENESGESASGSALAQLDEFADGKKIDADIPAILYVGAQYSPTKTLRFNAGAHLYFDQQATQYNNREKYLDGQGWELLAGAEYDINDMFTVSAGWQTTNYGLGDNSKYISDMSFVTNSHSVGFGARIHVSKSVAIDVSYFKTLYSHYDKAHDDYNNVAANFGNAMQQVIGGVTAVKAGLDPTDAATPGKAAALDAFTSKLTSLGAATTPGNDRLTRTNDVIGIGVNVSF